MPGHGTDELTINTTKLRRFIKQYAETDDRAEQRDIEDKVLAETVWKTLSEDEDDKLTLNGEQVELIHRELPDEAREAKRILRRYCLK